MKSLKTLVYVSMITFLSCCNNRDDPDSFIAEDFKAFNDRISQGLEAQMSWTNDPVSIVRTLFPFHQTEGSSRLVIEQVKSSEGFITSFNPRRNP
ncbi:hypothetical protein JMN32_23855 [Fulvivirga sp. 29W222]|uniref:Uncharacterized protein n=1 Tax=Fulvivirga marina TaxID=2494733 RepID=A0A937G2C2_9BACT|nr:hypothetical protein [Fulvivirga marina]MBL6449367.1 hypothetical protein [Fulvivirga marina]